MTRSGGRKPAPTALLKLRGSANTTRLTQERAYEPMPQGELIDEEPPDDLTDTQMDIWRYAVMNMPRGVMKRIDRDLLKAWVEAADRHNTARLMQAMLDRDTKLKLLIKTPNGFEASPYNDILDKTSTKMIRLAQEFGFSPASRPRIKADPTPIEGECDEVEPDLRNDPWSFLDVSNGPAN